MKWPPQYVLLAIAKMLKDAKYKNVAEHLAAGFLWSVYPEWFDRHYSEIKTGKLYSDLAGNE